MIAAGQRLDLELADGHIGVDARTGGPDETPEAEPAKSIVPEQQQRPQRTGGRGGGNQRELF
jgi:hypothetical protein